MMKYVNRWIHTNSNEAVLVGVDVVLLGVFGLVLGSQFFSLANMQSMATQVAEFGLLSLGMALAMLTGGIDLSVVSLAVLASITGSEFLAGNVFDLTKTSSSLVIVVAVIVTLVTGLLCGLLNGVLIAKTSIPPILTTLGTSIFFTGIGTMMTGGGSLLVKIPAFFGLGTATFARIPLIFLILAIALVIASLALRRTRSGRRIYLYGENPVALKFTGAKHETLIIGVYGVIGLICSIAALIMVSRTASARVGYGQAYLLEAILVVVLAGFDPFGGRGKILGLLLGLLMLQMLSSAFNMLGFDPYSQAFIWGAMLLFVMFLNRMLSRRRRTIEVETA